MREVPIPEEELISRNEAQEIREYKEHARAFAVVYRSVVDFLTGSRDAIPDTSLLQEQDRIKMDTFTAAVQRRLQHQAETYPMATMDTAEMLAPVLQRRKTTLSDAELGTIQIRSRDRVPLVLVPVDVFRKVLPGSRGVAFIPQDTFAFILMPVYEDQEVNEREQLENIPHETHHVAWKWAAQEGAVQNTEVSELKRAAFSMYQDELMARCVSDGALFGYTHLDTFMSAEKRAKATRLYGAEAVAQMNETVVQLNDLARRIQFMFTDRETDMTVRDVGLAVFRSTDFDSLKRSLLDIESHLAALPNKPQQGNGWSFV